MLRAKLAHPLAERRRAHRRASDARASAAPPTPATSEATAPASEAAPPPELDLAAARVREAGGPLDRASYACACGYLFEATVSTGVTCPHCGAAQVW